MNIQGSLHDNTQIYGARATLIQHCKAPLRCGELLYMQGVPRMFGN